MSTLPPDDDVRAALIAGWLARYDNIFSTYGVRLSDRPTIFDDFEAALKDIAPEDLGHAFEEWRRVGERFPVPADILGVITKRNESIDAFEAEKAWLGVRWAVAAFWQGPDLGLQPWCVTKITVKYKDQVTAEKFNGGFLLRPKPFDSKTQHAINWVGGLARIAALDGSEVDFCRKAFITAHQRASATKQYTQIDRSEAKELMEKLKKGLSDGN